MRTILTAIGIMMLSLPAFGTDCVYANREGDIATAQFAQITVKNADGSRDVCPSVAVGTGMPQRFASCASGFKGAYVFAPSKFNGKTNDLLIFRNDVWYGTCK